MKGRNFGLGASLINVKQFAEPKIPAALVNEVIIRVPSLNSTYKHGSKTGMFDLKKSKSRSRLAKPLGWLLKVGPVGQQWSIC
ncbi:hypothetical protein HanPI659440_Chr10g0363161 [Helianthus annuus]|nr:hypothetical protein HanPI659440_Chr10g0363161 [Helianthus annuus]